MSGIANVFKKLFGLINGIRKILLNVIFFFLLAVVVVLMLAVKNLLPCQRMVSLW